MHVKRKRDEGVEKVVVVLTEGEYKIRPHRKRQHKTVGATLVVAHFSTPTVDSVPKCVG